MNELNLKKLQNGSDIRGIALPGVSGEDVNLTCEAASLLTTGFCEWLSAKSEKSVSALTVAIGHDSRLSAEMLKSTAINAMTALGVHVLDCGLASTPAMFMATVFPEYRADGAIMITASHLPWNRNGFKYFDRDGGLNKSDIADIIDRAEQATACPEDCEADDCSDCESGCAGCAGADGFRALLVRPCNLMDTYCAHLRKLIIDGVNAACAAHPQAFPLAGLRIVVDAGNGAGGFYANKVLAPLGADVSGSQFLEPDGHFPNHAPNPEDKNAMDALRRQVLATGADFGLIFDTDVDRSAAVDEQGREIARNGIVALAAVLAAETQPGTTVVTDSITSDQLSVFLTKQLGLSHLRYKRGYKNVINKAIELNEAGIDCRLAIETSGHAAFKENYFLDDGAYLATKTVIKAACLRARAGQHLSEVLAGLEEPREAVEVRFPLRAGDFAAYGERILEALAAWAAAPDQTARGIEIVQPNYEGVRLRFAPQCGDGWCLLRLSLHDPIMPLNIESNKDGGCREIAEILRPFLSAFDQLDISKL